MVPPAVMKCEVKHQKLASIPPPPPPTDVMAPLLIAIDLFYPQLQMGWVVKRESRKLHKKKPLNNIVCPLNKCPRDLHESAHMHT